MKTNFGFVKVAKIRAAIKTFSVLMILLFFISCQKNEIGLQDNDILKDPDMIALQDLSSDCWFRNMTLYYGHEIFRRGYGTPFIETRVISNPDFSCYQDKFVLKVRSGLDKRSRLASGEIWIDGKLIVRQSDFNKNISLIVKYISGLTPESNLEIKLTGTPGSYIDLWIEGTMNKITPLFEQISPLCRNSTPPVLPGSSLNEPPITGTWQPAVINTAIVGKTTYTFTPGSGQCGTKTTMEIEVIESVVPAFDPIGPLSQGSSAPVLPSVSTNNITGAWIPNIIDTSKPGKYIFTFTPAAGQCAGSATIEIEITGNQTITDIEGNIYKIVKIGDQWWMAENLRTVKYNNGDLIGTTTPATLDISLQTEPKYQWAYNGDENNVKVYGRLYTWYAAADPRGTCPVGWHLPSDAEWTVLTDFLTSNGYGYEGSGNDIAKSMAATNGWAGSTAAGTIGNDPASNNMSGFTALPGGYRIMGGAYQLLGMYGSWWSSTDYSASSVWFRFLHYNESLVTRTVSDKKQGGAVRCKKDN